MDYSYEPKKAGRPKVKKDIETPVKTTKRGRPKKGEVRKEDEKFDKKEYMKNYMRTYMNTYNYKNKNAQLHRRNTTYYIKKFDIEKEFVDKYGIYTASVYKCMEDFKKIREECPMFLNDVKKFVEVIALENEEENKKNHIADLSGVEVLTEVE